VETALSRAGENRSQMQQALDRAPAAQQEGMHFLITFMPERDLKSLTADFLLENVRFAYQAWNESPWKEHLPKEVFLNNVLPYASVTERRDDWRKDFYERFQPVTEEAKTLSEAAAILNQKIFPLLKVRYSRNRLRADQSPYESINSGTASCTGLSILLINACRAVGVPARFAGTPLWTDQSGNHSWVEIWDHGWHFTGAAEPTGDELDRAWFVGRASSARRDHRLHAIYAVSYKHTPQTFPLAWNRDADYVFAVNVTDRYASPSDKPAAGGVTVRFRVLERPGGDRLAARLKVTNSAGKLVFRGSTKDERSDANDHLTAALPLGQGYVVEIHCRGRVTKANIAVDEHEALFTFPLEPPPAEQPAGPDKDASQNAVTSLEKHLGAEPGKRGWAGDEAFASIPLTREDAARAEKLLWKDHVRRIRETREAEMKARELNDGELKMPFYYRTFGDKPDHGRSMYISLHGGGGAPKHVNDRQWENQKRLYQLEEGVYVVPRAPTNTWNLWHQPHIDRLFGRLIENMIVFEDVDPNRVYLMGYSAGGDGVFQLAPRMADRWAAAAMMAGHPNETSPLGLRNLAFTMHVGGRDAAYNRNKVARDWEGRLAELQRADPDGYVHSVKIYAEKGHWLDGEDASAIPWMAERRRNPRPSRIVWKQDDVRHTRFYWLAVDPTNIEPRAEIRANQNGQQIDITADQVKRLTIRLNDQLLNLDEPIEVATGGEILFKGRIARTIGVLAKTLGEYGDPSSVYSGEVTVEPSRE